MQRSELASNHLRWIDLVRSIGAFLVVIAHVQLQGSRSNEAGIFYGVLSRIAVPMFFMASGYLLLGREEPYVVFFKKRALKVIVPFLAWSVIYMLWQREYFGEPFSLDVVAKYMIKILRGPRENHLWFFYVLIGLYLFTPILRVFTARASIRDLSYFCGLWFIVTPVLSTLQTFTPLQFGFELYLVAGYTGYYMLGYLIGKFTYHRYHLYALAVLFLLVCAASVAIIYRNSMIDYRTPYFGNYTSLNVVLMSVSAFIILRQAVVSDKFALFLTPLSKASFGIYLIHVIVLVEIAEIPPLRSLFTNGNSIYMIPLLGLLGFFISYIFVYILRKIPLVRYIVP